MIETVGKYAYTALKYAYTACHEGNTEALGFLGGYPSRDGRYIACDMHAHLVSKAGSLISAKSPSPVFKWSGI